MSEMQPWLGICHLTKQEGETQEGYQAIAAAFCVDRTGYDAALKAFVEPKGYHLVWSEEVHPAGQWIARHPKERNAVNLARTVHAQHLVEVGTLKVTGIEGDETETKPFLAVEDIKGVEPLDFQIGVDEPKTVPDALRSPLFDPVEPNDVEIEHYGGVENVPPMVTYAILDAAKVRSLVSHMERSGLSHKCLFKGEAEQDLKDVAPYIVELDETNDFTRDLFSSSGMPSDMWDKKPGIFVRSRESLNDLWKHFRKFTRLKDEHEKWFFLAFWEGVTWDGLIDASEDDKEFVLRLVGNHEIIFNSATRFANNTFVKVRRQEA